MNKMIKSLVVGSFALVLCIPLAPAGAQGAKKGQGAAAGAKKGTVPAPGAVEGAKNGLTSQIEGVTAKTIHVINGNRDHDTKLTARPDDVIQIDWALKASPPTTSVSVNSSSPFVVQAGAIDHLNYVNGPGGAAGHIVVRFLARKKGTAKLTFVIRRTKTDFSTVTSVVQVQ
jgi:hypothetical protein